MALTTVLSIKSIEKRYSLNVGKAGNGMSGDTERTIEVQMVPVNVEKMRFYSYPCKFSIKTLRGFGKLLFPWEIFRSRTTSSEPHRAEAKPGKRRHPKIQW